MVIDFVARYCSSKVFLLTGNGAMYLNDAMQIHPNIDYVCVRNEAVAPLAASAFSKLTGQTGTVCVTAGPGAANAIPGVIEAWVEGTSILVLSGQVPAQEKHNFGRKFVKEQRSFGIAGIPIIDYVSEFTKLAICLDEVEKLELSLQQIYEALTTGRPGPIWVDIPLDIQSSDCKAIDLPNIQTQAELLASTRKNIKEENEDGIEKPLRSAKNPLFLIGSGSESALKNGLLENWIDSTGTVFALTRPNAYFFPITKLGNLGVVGVRGRAWSKYILANTDLLIALGSRIPSSVVGPNYSYLDPSCKILLVNSEQGEFKRHSGRIINKTPIEVENFLQNHSLANAIFENENAKHWLSHIESIKLSELSKIRNTNESPLDLYWFCQNLEKHMNDSNVLTTDAGSVYYACGQSMTFERSFQEVTSGTFAAMGVSVPIAIGSAIAIENKSRIVCITGDGSFELNVQELQTISNYSLNIVIFVINNGGYASMRAWQDSYFDSRYIGSTDETGTKPMNFARIANAFNIEYEVISSISEFNSKISFILERKEPMIVEVICDPNQTLDLPMKVDLV